MQKLREAVLAFYFTVRSALSRGMPERQGELLWKDKMLNLYLHDAYFWNQLYGVGGAIEVYFGKDSLEYFTKIKERLWYDFERTYFWKLPTKQNIDTFPFVTQKWINGEMIKTNIDGELQNFARETLQQTLWELADKNVTNGAIFAINPNTKEILIYQGSKDFHARDIDGQVDVITSLRQPGSTMKPFLYLIKKLCEIVLIMLRWDSLKSSDLLASMTTIKSMDFSYSFQQSTMDIH